jgi:hypothetical protein
MGVVLLLYLLNTLSVPLPAYYDHSFMHRRPLSLSLLLAQLLFFLTLTGPKRKFSTCFELEFPLWRAHNLINPALRKYILALALISKQGNKLMCLCNSVIVLAISWSVLN